MHVNTGVIIFDMLSNIRSTRFCRRVGTFPSAKYDILLLIYITVRFTKFQSAVGNINIDCSSEVRNYGLLISRSLHSSVVGAPDQWLVKGVGSFILGSIKFQQAGFPDQQILHVYF
jgi:hypothetical protein